MLTVIALREEEDVKKNKNYTRLLRKIELTHFPVLCEMVPSIKLTVRQARGQQRRLVGRRDELKLLVGCQSVGNWVVLSIAET